MFAQGLADALPELRGHVESAMVTPCRISRTAEVTADPDTGADVPVAGALVYDGSSAAPGCKILRAETQVRDAESGSGTVVVQQLQVHVPVMSGPYQIGDLVEVLTAPRSTAAARRFRVAGLDVATWQTAQRLPVVELP